MLVMANGKTAEEHVHSTVLLNVLRMVGVVLARIGFLVVVKLDKFVVTA